MLYPVLVSASSRVRIESVGIQDSGSFSPSAHNNASGGILLEEGTHDFEIRKCTIRRVRGNAIWTHSFSHSPRNANGLIAENDIEDVARDAIQVGHATGVTVRNNTGRRIGYPFELVDMAGWAVPVALDTAGNVDKSTYTGNAGSPTPLARFRHRVVGFGGLVGSSGNGTLWQYVSGTQMQDLTWLAIKGFAHLQHVAPHIHAGQQSALMETLAKLLLADQKAACAGLLLGSLVTNQRVQVKADMPCSHLSPNWW